MFGKFNLTLDGFLFLLVSLLAIHILVLFCTYYGINSIGLVFIMLSSYVACLFMSFAIMELFGGGGKNGKR